MLANNYATNGLAVGIQGTSDSPTGLASIGWARKGGTGVSGVVGPTFPAIPRRTGVYGKAPDRGGVFSGGKHRSAWCRPRRRRIPPVARWATCSWTEQAPVVLPRRSGVEAGPARVTVLSIEISSRLVNVDSPDPEEMHRGRCDVDVHVIMPRSTPPRHRARRRLDPYRSVSTLARTRDGTRDVLPPGGDQAHRKGSR
jgi:hypothetical protein